MADAKALCTHPSIRFEPKTGSYRIFCNDCQRKWTATLGDGDEPCYEAMFESFGVTETRQSPFYVRPAKPPR